MLTVLFGFAMGRISSVAPCETINAALNFRFPVRDAAAQFQCSQYDPRSDQNVS
jgi:hypothetical protein